MALTKTSFLNLATLFEGGLIALAYLIGSLVSIDPLTNLLLSLSGAALGLLGALPLYGVFSLSYNGSHMRDIRTFLVKGLGPILAVCHGGELLYLALLAGVAEEILFRGCLQPWFEHNWGWWAGLLLSNVIFAVLHWVSPLYGLLAGLSGVYLGLSLDAGNEKNLLTPILIHTTYDFLAFVVIAQTYQHETSMHGRSSGSINPNDDSVA
jgi:membrane protease YdiL (CAAX protease family)